MADPLVAKYAAALVDWKSDYFMAPAQELRALLKLCTDLEHEVAFAWSDENDPLAEDNKALRSRIATLEEDLAGEATTSQARLESLQRIARAVGVEGSLMVAEQVECRIAKLKAVVAAAAPMVAAMRRTVALGTGLGLEWANEEQMGLAAYDAAVAELEREQGGERCLYHPIYRTCARCGKEMGRDEVRMCD